MFVGEAVDGFEYTLKWFDPVSGIWKKPVILESDGNGTIVIPDFPDGINPSSKDWAAKIIMSQDQ